MAKKDPSDTPPAQTSATDQGAGAGAVVASEARQSMPLADLPNPATGGRYTRDTATGELTCTVPATQPPPAMRKTQDPVTGAITHTAL